MSLRSENLEKMNRKAFDVVIVGGGINGAVSAAALSARGLRVALLEQHDFAGATSANSSNLAWGGIKYLENGEFLLVDELCRSRNHLMRSYPSSVREIRFLTSISRGFRRKPLTVFMGAALYWLMGRCYTVAPRLHSPKTLKQLASIINTQQLEGGVEYSDAYLFDNDARFSFGFVRKAMDQGCLAANYTRVTHTVYQNGEWKISAEDSLTGAALNLRATIFINAAGPWVDQLNQDAKIQTTYQHQFSKGVHLIVRRLYPEERVLAFFASDGRLFFVIPMGDKTCIGTTDTQVDSPEAQVTDEDRDFILENVNACLSLQTPLTRADILSERVGVRPLAVKRQQGHNGKWQARSRKHVIEVDAEHAQISIFGGKLTDCLNVGNEMVEHVRTLGQPIPKTLGVRWYGEPRAEVKERFFAQAKAQGLDYHDSIIPETVSQRLWRRYNDDAFELLDLFQREPDMAQAVSDNVPFLKGELRLVAEREMVVTLEDFVRRRSKLELVRGKQALANMPELAQISHYLFTDGSGNEKLNHYLESVCNGVNIS